MTRIQIIAGQLRVDVLGWDKLWAFKSRLEFPCENMVSARRWEEGEMSRFQGIRAPGTCLPGVIVAGTYHQRDEGLWHRNFFDVHHFEHALVILLQRERFSELVLEVEDPEASLQLIAAHLPASAATA